MTQKERNEYLRVCRKCIQYEAVLERIGRPGRYCNGAPCRCNDAEVFKRMARKILALWLRR